MNTYEREPGEFHVGHDLFFKRHPNGDVRVRRITRLSGAAARGAGRGFTVTEYAIPNGAWCSLVSMMSARGEEHGRFFLAEAFHNR